MIWRMSWSGEDCCCCEEDAGSAQGGPRIAGVAGLGEGGVVVVQIDAAGGSLIEVVGSVQGWSRIAGDDGVNGGALEFEAAATKLVESCCERCFCIDVGVVDLALF